MKALKGPEAACYVLLGDPRAARLRASGRDVGSGLAQPSKGYQSRFSVDFASSVYAARSPLNIYTKTRHPLT